MTFPAFLERYSRHILGGCKGWTKSGRNRTIPICAPLASILGLYKGNAVSSAYVLTPDKRRRKGRRWAFVKSFRRMVVEAGVAWLIVHGLRRAFATLAVQSGISVWKVKGWLGHMSVQRTDATAASAA